MTIFLPNERPVVRDGLPWTNGTLLVSKTDDRGRVRDGLQNLLRPQCFALRTETYRLKSTGAGPGTRPREIVEEDCLNFICGNKAERQNAYKNLKSIKIVIRLTRCEYLPSKVCMQISPISPKYKTRR